MTWHDCSSRTLAAHAILRSQRLQCTWYSSIFVRMIASRACCDSVLQALPSTFRGPVAPPGFCATLTRIFLPWRWGGGDEGETILLQVGMKRHTLILRSFMRLITFSTLQMVSSWLEHSACDFGTCARNAHSKRIRNAAARVPAPVASYLRLRHVGESKPAGTNHENQTKIRRYITGTNPLIFPVVLSVGMFTSSLRDVFFSKASHTSWGDEVMW